jgi:hypothetical protein
VTDVDALVDASPPVGVRLLPMGDPCLYLGDDLPPAPPPRAADLAAGITSRLVNSLTGRVVLDGEVVGAWGRVKGNVTVDPWPALPAHRVEDIGAEAASFASPVATKITTRWLPPR